MKSFTIGKNDANQRVDKFIKKTVPNLPDSLMYKYIRLKRIKLNGKRCEISTRLKEGDKVDMYINDEFFEQRFDRYDFMHASTNLTVIYEDENIMLLDKKVGLLSHPDEREYNDTLLTRIKRYLYEKGEYNPSDENSFSPALINRIDRNTGGIVMAAKNAEALRIMNQKLKDREIKKFYLCVVHGTLKEKDGTLHGWLTKDEKKNLVKVSSRKTEGSKEIKTKYRVLAENNGMSLVEVELLTGRTHQIRAHFASIGHPLLGDGKYGRNSMNKDREIKKFYLCVVHGTLKEKDGTLHGWLTKDEKKNLVKVSSRKTEGSKEIKTKYRVLAENNGMSLVEVELLTGRTHQIRAHFASIGHPLLGDGKYGRNSMNKESGYKKQFLYSYKLKFDFVTDAQSLNYLNGKQFEVRNVWFKDAFLNGEL